jgi:hypothetical protein
MGARATSQKQEAASRADDIAAAEGGRQLQVDSEPGVIGHRAHERATCFGASR